jgi:hypothetical protein
MGDKYPPQTRSNRLDERGAIVRDPKGPGGCPPGRSEIDGLPYRTMLATDLAA